MTHFPDLQIKYSLEDERKRVEETISKISWYLKHGYEKSIYLPGITLIESNMLLDKNKILHHMENEYKEKIYHETVAMILRDWKKIRDKWARKPSSLKSLKLLPAYTVLLTRYGTGGSYIIPNIIILNIRNKDCRKFAATIFHEIIHLAIEPFIQKHPITHWEKERLVDIIFKKLLPETAFEQNVSPETRIVDKIFENCRENIENTVRHISETRKHSGGVFS